MASKQTQFVSFALKLLLRTRMRKNPPVVIPPPQCHSDLVDIQVLALASLLLGAFLFPRGIRRDNTLFKQAFKLLLFGE